MKTMSQVAHIADCPETLDEARALLKALAIEVDALREDKARMNFLKEHTHLEFHVHHPDYAQTANGGKTWSSEGIIVRELIDNAREWLAKKS